MAKPSALQIISISIALLVALTLTVQYPLSTSFPIGGDAAFHAEGAQRILNVFADPSDAVRALKQTRYPAARVILGFSGILPISWPERFTWFMALGHFVTGLAIAGFLWRVSSWRAAAIGLVIWSLTTTDVTRHFEDGTLAQLWSLALAILYFERLAAKSTFGAIGVFIVTTLTHPLTGLVLIVSNLVALPAIWINKPQLDRQETIQLYGLTLLNIVALMVLFIAAPGLLAATIKGASDSNIIDLMGLYFAPFIIIAPIGGILLLTNKNISLTTRVSFATFASLSLLLAGNNFLGIGVWTERLRSPFVLTVAITAALALPHIVNSVFKSFKFKSLAIALILLPAITIAWQASDKTYRFYENEDNYARPRLGEINDIIWMANNLPAGSTIYSSTADRTPEWIPVLTEYNGISYSNLEKFLSEAEFDDSSYLFLLKNRESSFINALEEYQTELIHVTDDTSLYKL